MEYVKDFVGAQAAIRAGYSKKTSNEQAARLLANSKVKAAIEELSALVIQEDIATAVETAKFLTSVMRGDLTSIVAFNGNDGLLFTADSKDLPPEISRLIKKIKVTEKASAKGDWTEVQTSVEIHDPVRAAELLGRYHGMWKDKVEHTGKNSGPLTFQVVYEDKIQQIESNEQ